MSNPTDAVKNPTATVTVALGRDAGPARARRRAQAAVAIRADGSLSRALPTLIGAIRRRLPLIITAIGSGLKRALDIVTAAIALTLLAPLLGITALLIRLDSPGSPIFRQTRIGTHGRPFTMFKFRSMYIDAEARRAELMAQNEMAGGVIFKMKNDPRITRLGRFVRKTSIDELPQLYNVLRGDMSLVGPRPPLASEVAQYSPHALGRLGARPGLTCIWQVSGRSTIPFQQQVEMDLEYIHSQSIGHDVKLLIKTVPALVRGHGAH